MVITKECCATPYVSEWFQFTTLLHVHLTMHYSKQNLFFCLFLSKRSMFMCLAFLHCSNCSAFPARRFLAFFFTLKPQVFLS